MSRRLLPDRGPLSAGAYALMVDHLHSVGALDLFMLLRTDGDRWWSADDVREALRCPRRWAVLHLEDLGEAGLLDTHDDGVRRYAFAPRDDRLAEAADALATAYSTRTREVLQLLLAMPAPELSRSPATRSQRG
jgi:hypothetical protein